MKKSLLYLLAAVLISSLTYQEASADRRNDKKRARRYVERVHQDAQQKMAPYVTQMKEFANSSMQKRKEIITRNAKEYAKKNITVENAVGMALDQAAKPLMDNIEKRLQRYSQSLVNAGFNQIPDKYKKYAEQYREDIQKKVTEYAKGQVEKYLDQIKDRLKSYISNQVKNWLNNRSAKTEKPADKKEPAAEKKKEETTQSKPLRLGIKSQTSGFATLYVSGGPAGMNYTLYKIEGGRASASARFTAQTYSISKQRTATQYYVLGKDKSTIEFRSNTLTVPGR